MAKLEKKSVLVIGGGAVGAIAALNLEIGGLATVTIALRTNFDVVKEKGYSIQSCDHGVLNNWKPTYGWSLYGPPLYLPTVIFTMLTKRLHSA
jgi:hypothetical protein